MNAQEIVGIFLGARHLVIGEGPIGPDKHLVFQSNSIEQADPVLDRDIVADHYIAFDETM